MIYHQVRMSTRPDAAKEDIEHALELMRRLGRELDAVEYFVVGRDFGGEFEYGASYALKDLDAYRTYLHAPLHRQIDEAGLPLVTNMVSFDITDDEDPEFKAKIDKLHADRFAGDSGLSDLIDGLGSYQGSGTDTE